MMRKMLLASMLFCSSHVFADTAAAMLQAKLNAIHSMTAQFSQVVKAKQREISRSSGRMALERPGRFLWTTLQPLEQIVVADGKKMWVYDVDLEQVTVKKQEKGLGGTAALFLSGYDETVARDFDVSQSASGRSVIFDLKSKSSKESVHEIKLIFTQDKLTGLELYDQLGQVTLVKLKDIKSNPKLPKSLFQFKPPKGVDVVMQ